jgi:molybdopterin-containing oxidoreductase family membrane subunit
VTYSYIVEFGMAYYSGSTFETELFNYRALGDYKVLFWIMIACNSVVPLALFLKKMRRSLRFLFGASLLVNVGMWLERFVIIVSTLARDYDPYSWGAYKPSFVEIGITLGSFGLFFFLFLLFAKLLPVLSMSELKEVQE